jgi:hypothetical protein
VDYNAIIIEECIAPVARHPVEGLVMSKLVTELNEFHRYAVERAEEGGDVSIEECLDAWRAEQERREVVAHVQEGIADADAGRLTDLETFDREFRQRFNIPGGP